MKYPFIYCLALIVLCNTIGAESLHFESKSPYEFSELVNNLKDSVTDNVTGELTLPSPLKKHQKVPLIIVLEGTFGFEKDYEGYLKKLRDAGFATFTVRSYESRGIEPKTQAIENRVSPEMMASDAYFALQLLRKNPHIDAENVGLLSWNSGAGAALYAPWLPAQTAFLGYKKGFKAIVAISPPCLLTPSEHQWGKTAIKIIIGEKDASVPARACENLINQMKKAGVDAHISLIKNAYHNFDVKPNLKEYPETYSFQNCQFHLQKNGVVLHPQTGIRMTNPLLRLSAFFACVTKKNVLSGYIPEAHQQALRETTDFFKSKLLKH